MSFVCLYKTFQVWIRTGRRVTVGITFKNASFCHVFFVLAEQVFILSITSGFCYLWMTVISSSTRVKYHLKSFSSLSWGPALKSLSVSLCKQGDTKRSEEDRVMEKSDWPAQSLKSIQHLLVELECWLLTRRYHLDLTNDLMAECVPIPAARFENLEESKKPEERRLL